jgi:hypothetical protein
LQEVQELLALRVRHGAACDAVERKTKHEDRARPTEGR